MDHGAVDSLEEFQLALGLDSFGDDFLVQLLHHVHHVLEDNPVLLVVLVHVFEQGLVELDDVRVDIGERVQRRRPGSEVVDGYGNAFFAQLVHEVLHRDAVFEVGNFGQFDFDVFAVDVVAVHDGKDLACEGLVLEMLLREVRGNAYGGDSFVYPFAKVAADRFKYVKIQLADGGFLLEDGEEFRRRCNAVA